MFILIIIIHHQFVYICCHYYLPFVYTVLLSRITYKQDLIHLQGFHNYYIAILSTFKGNSIIWHDPSLLGNLIALNFQSQQKSQTYGRPSLSVGCSSLWNDNFKSCLHNFRDVNLGNARPTWRDVHPKRVFQPL